ncbi:MAG TPA: hypothetical protein VHE30_18910, partial [Polyangiaceae bacterium]|nr:hypothetical protein [Polyangiaceae bacterium]
MAPPSTRTWYGWQTLIADGVSAAALTAGEVSFSAQGSKETATPTALLLIGLSGATLGAPIVHWSHGRAGAGFASLGLRLSALTLIGLGG